MTKEEYLEKIKNGIKSLPEEEIQDAIKYYEEYLEDAENEEEAMKELGTPSQIIGQLKLDCTMKEMENKKNVEKEIEKIKNETTSKSSSVFKNIAIILLSIFAAPIAFPVALLIFTLMLTFVIAIFSICLALVCTICAIFVVGIGLVITGGASLFVMPGLGLIMAGGGFCLASISVLLFSGVIVMIKALIYGLGKIVRRLFVKGE